ncbi:MAG: transcription elongation factor GreA [Clostridiales bacterium GWB2_37_7]|nr:MAG: transcription elongation factor GreA [Clostridiales bacterium GWB2_37_7]
MRRRATVSKQNILTLEGLTKLEEELNSLKNKRTDVAERIKQALAFGDISENAEYDEAKKEQAFVEGRIIQIENILRTARVIDEDDIHTDMVSVGSKVLLKDIEFGDEVEYTIVGSAEADPMNLKISNESPVGKALVGKVPGDSVEIAVPDGMIKYQILQINK